MNTHIGACLIVSLCLFGCTTRSVPAPVVSLDTSTSLNTSNVSQLSHVVKSGETLYGIAWLYGKDYQDLARINRLTEPYLIQAGQSLILDQKLIKKPVVRVDKPIVGKITPTDKTKNDVASSGPEVYRRNSKVATVNTTNGIDKKTATILPTAVKEWVWPTQGRIVGKFSTAEAGNSGILIANAIGTPVVSAAEGKVVYVGNALRGYGNLVIIKHTDNYLSAYAHNNDILVQERQFVKAGQKIAEMGNSGTTEAKLRFEIRFKGQSRDPLLFLPKQ